MRKIAILALTGCLTALAPVAAAQTPSAPTLTRQQMIQLCRRRWQPKCLDFNIPRPGTGTSDVYVPPRREPQPQPPPREPETPGPAIGIAENAFACALAWRPGCPGEREAVQSLLQAGPSGVTYPTPTRFSVSGFLRNGWPIVVKYQIPAGAIAQLVVTPQFGGGGPFAVQLPPSPDGAPQLYKLKAEFAGGQQVVVANYMIAAWSWSATTQRYVNQPASILGFGAGPRAVGSVAIDQITYDPPAVTRPSGSDRITLTYTYMLKNDFDRVSEDLWRDCAAIGPFCNFSHPSRPYRPEAQGRHEWDWEVTRRTGKGQYQLVVRAWQTCGALADPDDYHQCGDELAWVIGSAGPVFIQ